MKALLSKIAGGEKKVRALDDIIIHRDSFSLPEKLPTHTRFVCIADTYNILCEVGIPNGDVFIHAGNFTKSASENEYAIFSLFLNKLPHKHKIIIMGDCDERLHNRNNMLFHCLNGMFLNNSQTIINKHSIYGTSSGKTTNMWSDGVEFPQCDIIITHMPPMGILDEHSVGLSVGDEHVMNQIDRIKPKVHIFGHIDDSYGVYDNGETVFINASISSYDNDLGFEINNPIVFDLKNK